MTWRKKIFLLIFLSVCLCVCVQVKHGGLSGVGMLWAVRAAEGCAVAAARPHAGGSDGQADPAGGPHRACQPPLPAHPAGRHEGLSQLSTFSVLAVSGDV